MSVQPIPKSSLDDRLGFVGTAGSGKTYNAGSAVERILEHGGRVIIPDPLGVWWGLRLQADGKTPSPYNVAIFGGPHGDLSLNEHAGALIGETAARMAESCVLDLSQLGTKASERRFMLAFLSALYKAKERETEPLHIIFDEADMWAPQRLLDKEGEAAKLLGMMETVVRRGRIKGFIPWLITQRPAVLSKDVLSQIDGLIAFKLTSSQDRVAIGDWVEGQADKTQWNEIWATLPTMQRGTGVVWIPGRGILKTVDFPAKQTFDSSRTPKRGEKQIAADLKPLDLEKLKVKLASVEAEAKANDPTTLRKEIARLKADIAKASPNISDDAANRLRIAADSDGYRRGKIEGYRDAVTFIGEQLIADLSVMADAGERARVQKIRVEEWKKRQPAISIPTVRAISTPRPTLVSRATMSAGNGSMPSAARKILTAVVQFPQSTPEKIGIVAGYSPSSGHFANMLGWLRSHGYVAQGQPLTATSEGESALGSFDLLPTGQELLRYWLGRLEKAPRAMLQALADVYPKAMSAEELGERSGYSASSGHFANMLGRLRTLELVERGQPIKLSEHLFA